jgi:hypothetical protein
LDTTLEAAVDRRCAFGMHCKARTYEDVGGQRRGHAAAIDSERGICQACTAALERMLTRLQPDYDRLSDAVLESGSSANEYVTGTPEPVLPINRVAFDLRSTLSEWCEAALWMVAEGLGIDVRTRHKAKGWPVKDGPVVVQAARVLPANVKRLLDAEKQPVAHWWGGSWDIKDMDGIDVAMELMKLHWRVSDTLGQSKLRRRLAMPCPRCGRPLLGIDDGTATVDCRGCEGAWPESHYDWLSGLMAGDLRTKETKENVVLQWCLAEAQWQRDYATWVAAEANAKLEECRKLASLDKDWLERQGISAKTLCVQLQMVVC